MNALGNFCGGCPWGELQNAKWQKCGVFFSPEEAHFFMGKLKEF